ncbi:MAG TPA: RimK/LysX family protein [Bacteroidia bacterium]|jgi:hypothetical protein|nr:RimK/LysX family protein [Bacteroidia bacterium]
MKKKKARARYLIGRREQIDFPDLGLQDITAKIDTGAYTTALHCHDIQVRDGVLYFKLLSPGHPSSSNMEHSIREFSQKDIRNSFGETEKRYVIKTRLRFGRRVVKSVISLTNRGTMRYPVLIGRRLLKNRFVVDVSQLNISSLRIRADFKDLQ